MSRDHLGDEYSPSRETARRALFLLNEDRAYWQMRKTQAETDLEIAEERLAANAAEKGKAMTDKTIRVLVLNPDDTYRVEDAPLPGIIDWATPIVGGGIDWDGTPRGMFYVYEWSLTEGQPYNRLATRLRTRFAGRPYNHPLAGVAVVTGPVIDENETSVTDDVIAMVQRMARSIPVEADEADEAALKAAYGKTSWELTEEAERGYDPPGEQP